VFLLAVRPLHLASDAGTEKRSQFSRICWGQQRVIPNNGRGIRALELMMSARDRVHSERSRHLKHSDALLGRCACFFSISIDAE
jgi:hypothetical protein